MTVALHPIIHSPESIPATPSWRQHTLLMRPLLLSLLLAASSGAVEKTVLPWSFTPLKRPSLPQTEGAWADLDRFILDRLRREGAAMNPPASRATLLRRITLDLHGLLPTPAEQLAFENDPAGDHDAFARVVDRLLDSPRFGERWARHWLDVVRYADSIGRSWNAPFIHAFRYRDWVIDAFNQDLPYPRFVAAQIAGDLMSAPDDAARRHNIIATGMLALGSMDLTALQYEQFRLDRIDDQIDVTSRAFLGLTLACARCHDHKMDPVSQADYYALAGIFESSRTWTGTAHKAEHRGNLYVEPDYLFRLDRQPVGSSHPNDRAGRAEGAFNAMDAAPAMMGMEVTQRHGNEPVRYLYDVSLAMAVSEDKPSHCAIRIAGDPYQEGKKVRRGELAIPGLPPLPKIGAHESGRMQLAQWITTPTHPLTARVMANRIWSHLFGRGIVRTVDDFGITGEKPSHPELLDHLAVRFVEHGWSVKKLIREIVLSRAYRQSSIRRADDQTDEALLGRMPLRRLELEPLRDTLLQVSGRLTFERPEGIHIQGNGGKGNSGRTRSMLDVGSPYRTIYLPVLRDLLPSMHEVWDFPNPSQIQGRRSVTTVPAQSLFLLNNDLVLDTARAAASRVAAETPDVIAALWRLLLCRPPSAEEVREAQDLTADFADSALALTALAQSLISSAEFRYRH